MEMKVALAMRSEAIVDQPLPAGPDLSVRSDQNYIRQQAALNSAD
jgi:hypothetical protein